MRGLTPSFKITYSEALQHTEEAINTEIKERQKDTITGGDDWWPGSKDKR